MTDHVARQILDSVVSTCTGLTTTGTNIFRSRVHTLVESSLPALLIYAREDILEEESLWRYLITDLAPLKGNFD
jgi:hypothetical protein